MRRRRSGFTFVELLTAMTIIAILAGIVIPKTGDFIKRAKAAAVVAEIRGIQDGVVAFNADSASYPPSAAMGQIPAALKPYLGDNFPFVTTDYQFQYNNWTLWTTLNGYPSTLTIIGITVRTDDARLGQLVLAQLATTPQFQWGNNYTFIVIGL